MHVHADINKPEYQVPLAATHKLFQATKNGLLHVFMVIGIILLQGLVQQCGYSDLSARGVHRDSELT